MYSEVPNILQHKVGVIKKRGITKKCFPRLVLLLNEKSELLRCFLKLKTDFETQ